MSVDKHEIKAFHNSTSPRTADFGQSSQTSSQFGHHSAGSTSFALGNGVGNSCSIGSNSKIVSDNRPDTNRWLVAGNQAPTLLRDNLEELTVEPGDTYWSLAKLVVSIRTGRVATSAEVKAMVREMAYYNGKTQCEATKIAVGDIIKVPPQKPKA